MLPSSTPIMIFSNSLLLLFGVVTADLLITSPAGGETWSGLNNQYTVTWIESNIVPLISDLESYIIVLYAGSNDSYVRCHFPLHLLPI